MQLLIINEVIQDEGYEFERKIKDIIVKQ